MIKQVLSGYIRTPLIARLLIAFFLGAACGLLSWYSDLLASEAGRAVLRDWILPFGDIFIRMLRMVVVPIVFFSLLQGASGLPAARMGGVGLKLILLYIASSFLAAVVGIGFALLMNPGAGSSARWLNLADSSQAGAFMPPPTRPVHGLPELLMGMFQNPFTALAEAEFLAIIAFAIVSGLAMSVLREESKEGSQCARGLRLLEDLIGVVSKILYKLVNWIMEYAPIGVFALSLVNFGLYGPSILGPYLTVVLGIIAGIFFMIFVVYGLLIRFVAGKNPLEFFRHIREPMVTAFVTRSSSAALPVSLDAAVNKLRVKKEVASFALPVGATINMDGVCVHLPMFAVLAANLFQLHLGPSELFTLVISTVLAAIGTGGVPGGSLMLMFIVLGTMGLSEQNTAVVVSLALGVNPLLDMFETMNNVTGDIMCAYLVGADKE